MQLADNRSYNETARVLRARKPKIVVLPLTAQNTLLHRALEAVFLDLPTLIAFLARGMFDESAGYAWQW